MEYSTPPLFDARYVPGPLSILLSAMLIHCIVKTAKTIVKHFRLPGATTSFYVLS